MFPTATMPEPPSPSRHDPEAAGWGTGQRLVLGQLCPWASPGKRLPITLNTPSNVRSGSCQGKHHTGVLLPPLFLSLLCFFLDVFNDSAKEP